MTFKRLTGRTGLGKTINKTLSKTNEFKSRKVRTVYGVLKESINGTYKFNITVPDENGNLFVIGPISLIESPQDLAARFGSPEDMVLDQHMVKITYSGPFIESGRATIVKNTTNSYAGVEQELAEKSNDLPVQGTAFAPPGASMI